MKLYKHNLLQQLGFPSGIDMDRDIVVMIREGVDDQSVILYHSSISNKPAIYYLPFDISTRFQVGFYIFEVKDDKE